VKHFCRYVTGLVAGDRMTVAAIDAMFRNNSEQSALNKVLAQAERDE
jgi:hypothetical protein